MITFQEDVVLGPADAFALAPLLVPGDPPLPEGSPSPGTPLPLREDRKKNVYLSPELLTTSGFGSLTVENGNGDIIVPLGVTLASCPSA